MVVVLWSIILGSNRNSIITSIKIDTTHDMLDIVPGIIGRPLSTLCGHHRVKGMMMRMWTGQGTMCSTTAAVVVVEVREIIIIHTDVHN